MTAENFISATGRQQIIDAIKNAEANTSGEIRVHIENHCSEEVLDRAAHIFEKLQIHKTEKRNGVLFYLAVKDHKFAILGDAGINAVTPDGFWNSIKDSVLQKFARQEFAEGLSIGITLAGEALKKYFPYMSNDVNELTDEISFGKN
ncbi:MAG: TPM domain-containing protein [Bacteroidales bacterium]|nr:TPM domain-containing protein [Bacteroidales bacterium]